VRVLRPLTTPWGGSALSRRVASALFTYAIKRELAAAPGETVLVATGVKAAEVVGRLGETASVYYCDRDAREAAGPRGAAREAELLGKVDLVVTTSAPLFEKKSAQHARVRFLPHGVDWDAFRTPRGRAPAALESMARPRVGFVGRVDERIDTALVDAVAAALPDMTFVMAGPRRLKRGPLDARLNVRFLPPVPYDDVPALLHALDAGALPYRVDALTESANPLKLRELLAAGVPVVSTSLPEVRRYAGIVRIARDVDEWVAALRDAVREGRSRADERSAAVRAETWERRREEFERFVTEAVQASRPASGGGAS
jgi:glycosyltransferase involved in cell wall biosynthesis